MTDRHGYRPAILSAAIIGTILSAAAVVLFVLAQDYLKATLAIPLTWAWLGVTLNELKR